MRLSSSGGSRGVGWDRAEESREGHRDGSAAYLRLGCLPQMCSTMVMVGSDAVNLSTYLREYFRVEVPIYFRVWTPPPADDDDEDEDGDAITRYAQISHQVYNKEEDYYRFRDAVNRLVSDGFTCAYLHWSFYVSYPAVGGSSEWSEVTELTHPVHFILFYLLLYNVCMTCMTVSFCTNVKENYDVFGFLAST